jgi:hypothetical protein
MKRPYLALATFALVAGLTPGQVPGVRANGLFNSAPVDAPSFAILARPVADDDWSLVVLEQLQPRPFCWTPRPDGLVDPTLNRFDYTGICGRFIDSNGYSLRIGDVDLGHAYRLRLQRQGNELQLLASTASRSAELVVGRGTVPRRDRDLFVALQLEPGWELRRRMFGDRSLNHVYFSNGQPLDNLIAAASGRGSVATEMSVQGPGRLIAPPPSLPPLNATRSESTFRRSESDFRRSEGVARRSEAEARRSEGAGRISRQREEPLAPAAKEAPADNSSSGVVALQVIPYVERNGSEGFARPSQESLSSSQVQ